MRDIPITNPYPPAADAGPRAHAPSKEEEQEEQELTGSHAEGKAKNRSQLRLEIERILGLSSGRRLARSSHERIADGVKKLAKRPILLIRGDDFDERGPILWWSAHNWRIRGLALEK